VKTLNEELQLLNHPDAIDQKRAYEKAIAHLTGENPDQLRMFLSGEGGTGKSKVLKLVIEFTRLHFGRTEGHHGAVIPMGPTGPSAHNINGFTYHTIAALGSGSSAGPNIGQKTAEQKGQGMRGVQLFIIDEISLVSKQDLAILEQRIKACILTTIEDPIEREIREKINHLPEYISYLQVISISYRQCSTKYLSTAHTSVSMRKIPEQKSCNKMAQHFGAASTHIVNSKLTFGQNLMILKQSNWLKHYHDCGLDKFSTMIWIF
jgi:hypothetical protein